MTKEPHNCHFCGTYVLDGYETITEKVDVRDYSGDRGVPSSPNIKLGKQWQSYKKRHWLSDCRPDLVMHEPGPLCTWPDEPGQQGSHCYAYQNDDAQGRPWTTKHEYFYTDGPT